MQQGDDLSWRLDRLMANFRILVTTAGFCLCSGAFAQEWFELSSLTFTPRPISGAGLALTSGSQLSANPHLAVEVSGSSRSIAEFGKAEGARHLTDSDQLLNEISATIARIDLEESRDGENSYGLIEHLKSLAALYQTVGDDELAMVVLERALSIARIHDGLYSMSQAELIEQMLESTAALGELAESAALQQQLLALTQRNPDDPRVADVLSNVADSQLNAARRYLDEGVPPVINIMARTTLEARWAGRAPPTGARYYALSALASARRNYGRAQKAAMQSNTHDVSDLLELEDKILTTYYFQLLSPDLRSSGTRYSRGGRFERNGTQALEIQITNAMNFPGTPEAIADAMIALGDWLLMFSSHGAALEKYRAAHDVLVEGNVPAGTIDAMLSPEIPVFLPAVAMENWHSEPENGYRGYIDVAVELNRYGHSTDFDILDKSPGATESIERQLRKRIIQGRFRPRFVDGELARNDSAALRFYFDY